MTGQSEFELLAEQFDDIMADCKISSAKNQRIFNEVCKNLALSQSKPLQEFVDILFEKLMYPRESMSLILNLQSCNSQTQDVQYEIFDLGHPRILELIMLRQKILETKTTGTEKWESDEYAPRLLRNLNRIYLLLVNLLQVLSDHIEVPTHSAFYRQIVSESVSDFQIAFETFNSLDIIFRSLLKNAEQFGTSDDRLFHVDEHLLSRIKNFSNANQIWLENLLIESVAVKEYMLVEGKFQFTESKIKAKALDTIYEPKFEQFLLKRKARLNISNRRIF